MVSGRWMSGALSAETSSLGFCPALFQWRQIAVQFEDGEKVSFAFGNWRFCSRARAWVLVANASDQCSNRDEFVRP